MMSKDDELLRDGLPPKINTLSNSFSYAPQRGKSIEIEVVPEEGIEDEASMSMRRPSTQNEIEN